MIVSKTPKEIEIMRANAQELARILLELKKQIKPGIKGDDLEKMARSLINQTGGVCSFLNYTDPWAQKKQEPFPACLCFSVNEEIVHGSPYGKILEQGDIVSLDLGLYKNGYHADMAISAGVGKVSPETNRLLKITKKVLKLAIKKARPGNTLGDVGNTIQRFVESQGFAVVRELCGHGIGRDLHEEPQILNFGQRNKGLVLKEGMVLCLEPMVTMGDWRIKKGKDGFSYITRDNSLSAHFEQMIAITKKGAQVLA